MYTDADADAEAAVAAAARRTILDLVRMLASNASSAAAGALQNLAMGSEDAALIAELDAVPPLVALLADAEPRARENAAAALHNLAWGSSEIAAVIVAAATASAGAVPDLAAMRADGSIAASAVLQLLGL